MAQELEKETRHDKQILVELDLIPSLQIGTQKPGRPLGTWRNRTLQAGISR